MANPYTSVSVSGYNADAPSDDGSAVASNQLNWSKHVENLGNPLRTAIESVNANALSAFALLFGATHSSQSTNYTITTADRGRFIEATAALTFTLPAAATAGVGFPIALINTSATTNMTVDGDSSETINGSTSIVIPPYGYCVLTCDGSSWLGFVSAETGTFTGTLTGFAADPTPTITWVRSGSSVRILIPATTSTSDATAMQLQSLPAAIRPVTDQTVPVYTMRDDAGSASPLFGSANITASTGNVAFGVAQVDVTSTSLIEFDSGGFTASGTKGFLADSTFEYSII